MPEITSLTLEKRMYSADAIRLEMIGIVRLAAEPVAAGEHIGELIRRAAVRVGIGYGRAKRLWYGEVAVIPAHEADMLRDRRKALLRERQRRLDAELRTLQLRLDALDRE